MTEVQRTSNITPTTKVLPHKAARLIGHLEVRGASITLTSRPWSPERRAQAVAREPHKSSHGKLQFVSDKMLDFCCQGHWLVLPYAAVADWPHLRISPLGVVPQHDRRPRLIVDSSFPHLNYETIRLAPQEAMQFGQALQHVYTTIVHADPQYGPVYLSKNSPWAHRRHSTPRVVPKLRPWTCMWTTSSYWLKLKPSFARCCVPPCRPSTTCSAPSIRRIHPTARSRPPSRKCSKATPTGQTGCGSWGGT